jgi:hypothetical protein
LDVALRSGTPLNRASHSTVQTEGVNVAAINTEPIKAELDKVCNDTTHTPEESAEAWEDIAYFATVSASAIREELEAASNADAE